MSKIKRTNFNSVSKIEQFTVCFLTWIVLVLLLSVFITPLRKGVPSTDGAEGVKESQEVYRKPPPFPDEIEISYFFDKLWALNEEPEIPTSISLGAHRIRSYKDSFWSVAKQELTDTPMEWSESYLWNAGQLDIDPVLLLAIAKVESNYGEAYRRVAKHRLRYNNPFGIMAFTKPIYILRPFENIEESIMSKYGIISLLERKYGDLDTIEEIGRRYTAEPDSWTPKVVWNYERLWKKIIAA